MEVNNNNILMNTAKALNGVEVASGVNNASIGHNRTDSKLLIC